VSVSGPIRKIVHQGGNAVVGSSGATDVEILSMSDEADLILHNGKFTTLDRSNPAASAVAIATDSSPRLVATKISCGWLARIHV